MREIKMFYHMRIIGSCLNEIYQKVILYYDIPIKKPLEITKDGTLRMMYETFC